VVDGSTGTDTVALTGNTAFAAATYFNNVKNIEVITVGNTNTAVTITTQDTLVAAGATLTLTNAANSGVLTFNGSAETDGAFTITGGTGNDSITGGSGNDTFSGGTGNDTFIFAAGTGLTTDTVNGGTGTAKLRTIASLADLVDELDTQLAGDRFELGEHQFNIAIGEKVVQPRKANAKPWIEVVLTEEVPP